MENNFYVGEVIHKKKIFKFNFNNSSEKLVLYTEDNDKFLDLLSGKSYTCDENNNSYVRKDSLVPTDVNDYKTDYLYLLNKNKVKKKIKIDSTRN